VYILIKHLKETKYEVIHICWWILLVTRIIIILLYR